MDAQAELELILMISWVIRGREEEIKALIEDKSKRKDDKYPERKICKNA